MSLNAHFREISWNLQILSSVIVDQTLLVQDRKLFIEDRGIWSSWWRVSSTRTLVLDAIAFTWILLDQLLVSYQNCRLLKMPVVSEQDKQIVSEILQHLNEVTEFEAKVCSGLTTLATFKRYQNDHTVNVRIASLIRDFQLLCIRTSEILRENTTF